MDMAYRAASHATNDEKLIRRILDEAGCMLKEISMDGSPPETGEILCRKIHEITNVQDPYKDIKQQNIKEALSIYSDLKERVRNSEDPLETAIRIAIAGNVIDMGIGRTYNIFEDLKKILVQDFGIFDIDDFKEKLSKVKSILYLGDNAGESVLDKILIEELNKPVIYVVRDIPVLNDATHEDAVDSGLDEVAEIISSGSTAPGTILNKCKPEFIKRFNEAEMIISKGQGNYETLSENNQSIFFLLKAKCNVIARDLRVAKGDIILKFKS